MAGGTPDVDCGTALVFGGSFDPPHRAHVELPEHVRDAIDAEVVLYIPTARSPFKAGRPGTDAKHRLVMTQLAVADNPRAVVLSVETAAAGDDPTYTIDTLRAMHHSGAGTALRLLIGADQLPGFDRWRDAARIIEIADPVVIRRPGEDIDAGLAHVAATLGWRPTVVDAPLIDVNSTELRRRLAAGEPVRDDVPPAVLEYIEARGLYRDAGG